MSAPGLQHLIIFTDLDGTLLDHHTYSHAQATPALERLRRHDIPLILASSKTAAEIAPLREALGFAHCPAIVENGAGMLEPGRELEDTAERHGEIRQILDQLPAKLRKHFQGFSDWSVDQLAERTGLTRADAENARNRQFSEPGLWLGNEADRAEFVAEVSVRGLQITQGGRFLTPSFGGSKARCMREIAVRHATDRGQAFAVALGDAENDVDMIEQADLGVIIPNPAHRGIPPLAGEATGSVIRAGNPGPAGWNSVMMGLMDHWELD
ncbi:HAD-IIB family hydrolase [Hoeflea olei]|uniref:HAD-IIB family hydrolase n=1 Tax=Hoeflea olei TaxID=1480615 RepID=UPI001FD98587|nr:HAD-IIB family hydrolase [Hoeflea olei]